MADYSITELAKKCGLSRSTLLYYSKIGLLNPAGRSAAQYRVYGDQELERLQTICRLRETGLSLRDIAGIIDIDPAQTAAILTRRLEQIHGEIRQLHLQQEITLKLLRHPEVGSGEHSSLMTKEKWTGMLVAAGLDEAGLHRWHAEFERSSGEAHHHFLASLGIAREEIQRIRAWSRLADT